jgi:ABC-type sulfate transport system substrate-binding protein
MWPFKRKAVVYPFRPFIQALIEKDEKLFTELGHLSPSLFWREWKKVHPEDFPHGGRSLPHEVSIVPRR